MSYADDELLSRKQLAHRLGRAISYVAAMLARGFPMPGRRCTLRQALDWLTDNPNPRSRKVPVRPTRRKAR